MYQKYRGEMRIMSRMIVEDKNIELLRNGQLPHLDMSMYDNLTIFVKDMTKPLFTPEDVLFLFEHFTKETVSMISVATRDEMMFNIGGHVYSGEPCTLVQMEIQVPDSFAEKVHMLSAKPTKTTRKSTSSRKRPVKAEPQAVTMPKEPVNLVQEHTEEHTDDTEPSGL